MHPLYIASDISGILLSFIDAKGIEAPELVAQIRVDGAKDKRIDYHRWCEYLLALREITHNPLIGVELGLSVQPHHCGVLGYLSLNCQYLGEALMRFERYQRLLYGGSPGEATLLSDRIRFTWPLLETTDGIALSNEVLLFGLASFVKRMVGRQDIAPIMMGFTHTPTIDKSAYQEAIGGGQFQFGSDALFVEFPLEYLSLEISNSDPALLQLLDQQAETLLAVLPDTSDFETKLKNQLLKTLQEGEPTLERLAGALCMSSRTLHRRLADLGFNFAQLLKKTRTELAIQYLNEGKLSLSEIAFLLGYSEQSAFSRAFKSWTGKTPNAYRK